MSQMIPAVFASGVFRPLEPVELAEGTQVQVQVPLPTDMPSSDSAVNGLAAWPAGYFEQTAGALAGEKFERPPQGNLPQREAW